MKTNNFDLYQTVTDRIVALIESEPGQWLRPWVGTCGAALPFNAATGATYRGVNVLLLWSRAAESSFASNTWASYNQWLKIGAQVRKGEKGEIIVYYGTAKRRDKDAAPATPATDNREDTYRFLKYSRVFNADQVDGYQLPAVAMPSLADLIEGAEEFIANTGADIRFGGARAFYRPAHDFIGMPARAAFIDTETSSATEAFYGTLLHELTHWTGHPSRCDREFSGRFGDDDYAMEELVAELGAAFACAHLGISAEPRPDHAQYLAQWLKVLRADKKAIFTAASKASDALDHLDGLQYADGPDDNPGESVPALPAPPPALPAPAHINGTVPSGATVHMAKSDGSWLTQRVCLRFAMARESLDTEAARQGWRITRITEPDPQPVTAPEKAPQRPAKTKGHGHGFAKVGGCKIAKRWDWTPDYRRHVQTQARALARPYGPAMCLTN